MSTARLVVGAITAMLVLFIGVVFAIGSGPEDIAGLLVPGLVLCGIALVVFRWALRGAGRTALAVVIGATLFALGPCTLFFLAYSALPPFQQSDSSGAQWQIRRGVPGEVRYSSGYGVAVSAPTFNPTASPHIHIRVIPVRFSNSNAADFGHVGRCVLYVDGDYRDPHREAPEVRSMGDVDGGVVRFAAGEGYQGRVAFEIVDSAKSVRMSCSANAYVPAVFDFSQFAPLR